MIKPGDIFVLNKSKTRVKDSIIVVKEVISGGKMIEFYSSGSTETNTIGLKDIMKVIGFGGLFYEEYENWESVPSLLERALRLKMNEDNKYDTILTSDVRQNLGGQLVNIWKEK